MTTRVGTFRNRRYNGYVPACGYAADVIHGGMFLVDLGAPAAASATAILNGTSIAAAVDTSTFVGDKADAPFGRNLQVVASGAATSNVTVYGRDYLGQPMRESFTLNGATPVVGVKAFYWIDRITAGVTAGTTINVGWGARFGLPYKTQSVTAEMVNDAAGTVGTFTAGVNTDPQTATTADPRGLYTPNGTVNGANTFELRVVTDNEVNSSGNGGLHGIRHFF